MFSNQVDKVGAKYVKIGVLVNWTLVGDSRRAENIWES
jgi:hypothetical protein